MGCTSKWGKSWHRGMGGADVGGLATGVEGVVKGICGGGWLLGRRGLSRERSVDFRGGARLRATEHCETCLSVCLHASLDIPGEHLESWGFGRGRGWERESG